MALIKTLDQIQSGRKSGALLAEAMDVLCAAVKPGMTTNDLDALFVDFLKQRGATPTFLGYKGYPKTICASVNNQVVHAIPSNRVLEDGDIIGIDCGLKYEGFITDMARTVAVGSISEEAQRLIEVTRVALQKGIEQLYPGNMIGDIGAAIQTSVESHGFGVVRSLVGHGVGDEVHEEPNVPNYGIAGTGMILEPGMVLALEPMVTLGHHDVEMERDGWTIVTADGTLSAHFEDTIAVVADGHEVLTKQA